MPPKGATHCGFKIGIWYGLHRVGYANAITFTLFKPAEGGTAALHHVNGPLDDPGKFTFFCYCKKCLKNRVLY